ncbi:hypothetical protein BGAPBR_K0003 (plasmid) [Borreliella garinii PBr]|uniref:Uncharacterized protein n=1 Tax=Borreliella garinii PBr TaxID=498743 RepID=B8F0N6_BORGR|nr:hypothetical protein [Borreliella garinii]ACL34482.1 hypothetical protein BGAPBR_K0003 [Borreliella garinii PBr]
MKKPLISDKTKGPIIAIAIGTNTIDIIVINLLLESRFLDNN